MADERQNARLRLGVAEIARGGLRLLGFVGLWFVLTRGEVLDGWPIGVLSILLAMIATYWLASRRGPSIRLLGLLRFLPFFVRRSVLGAVDVARRAFRPSRPLAPQVVDYPLRMRPDSVATITFVGVISLLPGTLCAGLSEAGLSEAGLDTASVTVHVIDRGWPIQEQLAQLEEKVAAVFGEPIKANTRGEQA